MRIVQVVTYISRDGAFGGPVAVAINQAVESARQGHEVTLVAGWDGVAEVDAPGVDVKLFPARWWIPKRIAGFSGLVAPALIRWLRREQSTFDVLHFQLARDLVALPAAAAAVRSGHLGVFVQTHGMVVPDSRLRSLIFDRLAVRRVLRGSAAVLAYPGKEQSQLRKVAGGPISVRQLTNGVGEDARRRRDRGAVRDVLFMARLDSRKRPERFVGAALSIRAKHPEIQFSIVGPDQGELGAIEAFIEANQLTTVVYEGPIAPSAVRQRLSAADIYVLPSDDEPFPITVLEALAAGTPTMVTDTCGIAELLRETSAALVVRGSADGVADGIESLISDTDLRTGLSELGPRVVRDHFSITAVVTQLLAIYSEGKDSSPTL